VLTFLQLLLNQFDYEFFSLYFRNLNVAVGIAIEEELIGNF
jgi:hypothetical protein